MRLRLIAVGGRPPAWAGAAVAEYLRRLPVALKLEIVLLPLARGHERNPARAVAAEGQRILARLAPRDAVIALDARGGAWSTGELAQHLHAWQSAGTDVSLLAGGPDGLSPACRERAEASWSLSALTLPHALVRVIVVEQIYRAVSLNAGHPYHRG